nr:RagB/SusD family nutrient uptake outer membrane protein [uncultured Proteiniphilum sp.]
MYSLYGYEADGFIIPEDYDAKGNYKGATQIGNFGPGDIKYKYQLTVDKRVFNPNKDYLWPIPYIERKTNPSLIQNPNWE